RETEGGGDWCWGVIGWGGGKGDDGEGDQLREERHGGGWGGIELKKENMGFVMNEKVNVDDGFKREF
ncbi:hypothetical protein, partial [Bacillus velezensis]|uniref:hypothetical protein n=1 Tax=Bacillus velezensis TaxID=492670 RepID=UPI001C92E9FA